MNAFTEQELKGFKHKYRNLPVQVDNAIARLRSVLNDCERYGRQELIDQAWDRIISEAQADALEQGGSIGFGDGKR